ncbi:MAG: hypothetical protein EOP00_05485 [Pedobacter sp.]|nr:MAG: hypothetical protein EOP00_05485 [Pedobacter sp.]
MISTLNLNSLPDYKSLRKISKAIAVLDAIICPEWEYRYYSYDANWAEGEEFLGMRNGEGDQMLILFREDGCVINGFAHEAFDEDNETANKQKLTAGLPEIFNEFIFQEPVKSVGTTFCIWSLTDHEWQIAQDGTADDGSDEMLGIFDGNPQTYVDWATVYFEESYKETGIPLSTVKQIYEGKTLTKELVRSLVDEVEDWQQLEAELIEIGYPYNFK